jgi:hypothetical protein
MSKCLNHEWNSKSQSLVNLITLLVNFLSTFPIVNGKKKHKTEKFSLNIHIQINIKYLSDSSMKASK